MTGYSALRPLSVLHVRAVGRCSRTWRCGAAPSTSTCWSTSPVKVAAQQSFFSSSSSKPPESVPTPGALLEGAVRQLVQPHIDEAELRVQRLREEVQAQAAALEAASKKDVSKELSDALAPHVEEVREALQQEVLVEIGNRFHNTQNFIEEKASEILSKMAATSEAEAKLDAAVASFTAELSSKPSLEELNKIIVAELEKGVQPVKEELTIGKQTLSALKRQVQVLEEGSSKSEAVQTQVKEAVAGMSEDLKKQVQDLSMEAMRSNMQTAGAELASELEGKLREALEGEVRALEERSSPEALKAQIAEAAAGASRELQSQASAHEQRVSEIDASIRQDMATKLAAADLSKALEVQLGDDSSALAKALAARLTSAAAQQLINSKVQEALAPLQAELRAKLSAEEARALVAEQVQEALAPLQAQLHAKLSAEDVKALLAEQAAPPAPADMKALVAEQVEIALTEQRLRPIPEDAKVKEKEKPPRDPVGNFFNFLTSLLSLCVVLVVALAGVASLPAKPKATRTSPVAQEEK